MHDTTTITFRLKQAKRKQLEALAKLRGTSLSGVVGEAIDQMLGDSSPNKNQEIKRRQPHTVRLTYRGNAFRDQPQNMGESAERTRGALRHEGFRPY
jgi:hypothetical protein